MEKINIVNEEFCCSEEKYILIPLGNNNFLKAYPQKISSSKSKKDNNKRIN